MSIPAKRVLQVEGEMALPVLKALGSDTRLLILSLLSQKVMNVSALTEALGLPHSTVVFNLKQLEQAGLLHIEYVPGTRGSQKLISRRYEEIAFKLPGAAVETAHDDVVEISMPIGNYRHCEVTPTCGLASDVKYIGQLDDPRSFYEPEHVFAQCLWFRSGFVEYAFPNNLPYGALTSDLELSMEICSEAPQYDLDWPSDVTLWINDVEVGTWTSPADYGGERGKLTPRWWADDQTMYGLLKRWRVTSDGAWLDGERLSPVTLHDLQVEASNHIRVRLGVKPDARNVGGLNLFGKRAGNYAQDLAMRLNYAFAKGEKRYQPK